MRDKQSRRLTLPGYDALNDLLGAIDPAAYARALTVYLQTHAGLLPRSLALDGKSVGNGRCGMIVTLCRHEDGRPVAMTVARGQKEDGRLHRTLGHAASRLVFAHELSVLLFRYHWAAALPRGHTATQKSAASSSRNLRLPKRR